MCPGVPGSPNNVGLCMKIVDLKQGSKDWLVWRNKGIGASDSPAIIGESPWTTYLQLWLEKTGIGKRPPANEYQIAAMRRGVDLEPVAREMVEKQLGMTFPAVAAEHDLYPFIKASFDGYNEEHNILVEIKCPSKVDHLKATKGKVPSKYYPQLQHQLMVSGAYKVIYASYDGEDDLQLVDIYPDKVYQTDLLIAILAFWVRVQKREMPEVTEKDLKKAEAELSRAKAVYDAAARMMDILALGKMPVLQIDPELTEV